MTEITWFYLGMTNRKYVELPPESSIFSGLVDERKRAFLFDRLVEYRSEPCGDNTAWRIGLDSVAAMEYWLRFDDV